MIILLFPLIYALVVLFYIFKINILSTIILLSYIIYFYIYDIKKNKNYISLSSLFTIGFLGSFSISFLKLSNLSSQYSYKFFITIFLSYFSFLLSYKYINIFIKNNSYNLFDKNNHIMIDNNKNIKFIYNFLLIIMFISSICFIIELIKLKFIPLFIRNVPHAYSTFHIFLLHYLTTLYIFVPSISITYYYYEQKNNNINNIIKLRVIVSILYSILMSLLLVSRGQLLMSLIMMFFTYILLYINNKEIDFQSIYNIIKKNIKNISIIILIILILYIVITYRRSHSLNYLNDIFDMKYKNMPLFITQPYMYLTEGFENLNYMINNIKEYTYGKRILNPLWTLTFMNKIFPFDFQYETLLLKIELNNTTIFYDIYNDFSYFGVVVLSSFFGSISYLTEKYLKKCFYIYKNPIFIIFYIQIAYYFLMSFFQPFFSLTPTYVYLLLTLLCLFIYKKIVYRNL